MMAACLASCGTAPTSQLMPPVTTSQPLTLKTNKTAILYWDYGKIISAEVDQQNLFDVMPVGMLIHAADQAHEEQYDQNDLIINYGKAEQVVFMTSLRDILVQSGAFKKVILSAESKPLAANQWLISLNFKKSIVLKGNDGYPIELDVVMTVSDAKGQLAAKEFIIKPKNTLFSDMFDNFKDAQVYASSQLMNEVVTELNQLR